MTPHSNLAIGLSSRNPASEIRRLAVGAEEQGFDQVWLAESYHARSSTSLASMVAASTSRIRIGLGLLSPYTRHPALIAMEAATLDEISNGRILLAIGAAKSAMMRHGLTVNEARPALAIADAIRILRPLLSGERVAYEGRILKIPPPGVKMELKPKASIPLYVGAAGPLALRVGGKLADGIILMALSGPAYVDYALKEASLGAKRANRSVGSLDLAAYLVISVADRRREAIEAAKPVIAWYIPRVAHVMLQAAGLSDARVEAFVKAAREVGDRRSVQFVDDDLVEKLSVSGTPEEVADRLAVYLRRGLKTPIAYEALGPDRLRALKTLRETVQPRVETLMRR